jgi:hypothetical protein
MSYSPKHLISTKQDLFLCSCGARFPIASRSDEDIQGASRLANAHVDVERLRGTNVAEIKYSAPEQVDHPSHYGGDTVYETIKVIAAWGLGFLVGNCVKYLSRAGKKDPTKLLEDLKKARWYLDEAIKRVERNEGLF